MCEDILYKYIYNVVFDFQISNKNCQSSCVSSLDLWLFAFCDFLSLKILSIKRAYSVERNEELTNIILTQRKAKQ